VRERIVVIWSATTFWKYGDVGASPFAGVAFSGASALRSHCRIFRPDFGPFLIGEKMGCERVGGRFYMWSATQTALIAVEVREKTWPPLLQKFFDTFIRAFQIMDAGVRVEKWTFQALGDRNMVRKFWRTRKISFLACYRSGPAFGFLRFAGLWFGQ
jgi:hypothetical protein